MNENLDRSKKMSRGKAMLAAIGMAAAAESGIPSTVAEAQTIYQYSHDVAGTQDPMINKLPKDTTVFQAAGPGQVNLLDGAKLNPKISHIYQTTRGGTNIIVNKDKIRKDVVIIQEGGGSNVVQSGPRTNSVQQGAGNVNIVGDGNVIRRGYPGSLDEK